MPALTLDWLTTLVLLGAAQGFFLSAALATQRRNRAANTLPYVFRSIASFSQSHPGQNGKPQAAHGSVLEAWQGARVSGARNGEDDGTFYIAVKVTERLTFNLEEEQLISVKGKTIVVFGAR